MRARALTASALALTLCAAIVVTNAAPNTKHDELIGEYGRELDSPVIYLPDDTERKVYWLVFADSAVETQANKIERGQRVKATGRLGAGGRFRYLVATTIAKEGE